LRTDRVVIGTAGTVVGLGGAVVVVVVGIGAAVGTNGEPVTTVAGAAAAVVTGVWWAGSATTAPTAASAVTPATTGLATACCHSRPNACRATAVGGRPEWGAPGFSL